MGTFSEARGRLGTLAILATATESTDVYRPPYGGRSGVLFSIQTDKAITVAVLELDENGNAVQFEDDIAIAANTAQKIELRRPFFGGYLDITNDDAVATATVKIDVAERAAT